VSDPNRAPGPYDSHMPAPTQAQAQAHAIAVAVVGVTGSGKSSVAMAIARAVAGCEIVAADAMTVYRGLDVGTAKPTARDRADVVHHCLDLADPSEDLTVVDYRRHADGALAAIAERRHRALLVGGTGLYLRAVLDRLDPPGIWPEVRAELEARIAAGGHHELGELHAELHAADPDAAARIEPGNARRIVRALEVWRGSGRRFSSFGPGLASYPPIATRQVGLAWNREALTERLAERVDAQLAAGWLDEVAGVWDRCGRTASQVIGYRELAAHLAGDCSLDEAVANVVARTRRFAVRQERWLRRDPRIEWYCGEEPDVVVASVVSTWH
jgi:tRNA dimethylallyltransferase